MLALWEYFWAWNGATPAAPTPVPTTPGRGSGKNRPEEYQPAPEDYWKSFRNKYTPAVRDTSEQMALLQTEVQQLLLEDQQLTQLQSSYQQILAQSNAAASISEMKALADYGNQLKAQIDELETTYKAHVIRVRMLQSSLYH